MCVFLLPVVLDMLGTLGPIDSIIEKNRGTKKRERLLRSSVDCKVGPGGQ